MAQINYWEVHALSINIRIFFEKKGRAKYISHLDITRCFSRAIRRTDIPVWHTEGFNPRIYMTFPLPLPLGFEGERETFDIRLIDDTYPLEKVKAELNKVFPEGIKAISVQAIVDDLTTIEKAIYTITLKSNDIEKLEEEVKSFSQKTDITVEKKSKKGIKTVNIAPDIAVKEICVENNLLKVKVHMSAGINYNINPNLWINAFMAEYGYDDIVLNITRNFVLRADGTEWE